MSTYRGRFAPSPTGPLHLGSLLTAVASYLDARAHHGKWLVRIDNIDPPREMPGASSLILATLEQHGFRWDESVLYQSTRKSAYEEVLGHLEKSGLSYLCSCSRKLISQIATIGMLGPIYPGTCRDAGIHLDGEQHSVRLKTDDTRVSFEDRIQGQQQVALNQEIGDFVIRRADGFYAYHLATAVDDHYQGITHVVRGRDLLENTFPQYFLQSKLNYPHPAYTHIPIVTLEDGTKLSKQSGAAPISSAHPQKNIVQILNMLGQKCPNELHTESLDILWNWAIANWNSAAIPRSQNIPIFI